MRKVAFALAASVGLMLPAVGHAAVQASNGTDSSLPFLVLSSAGLAGATPATLAGGTVLNQSERGLTLPQGASNYLGAGPSVGNPSTLTFVNPVSYVSFLWGTPDTYNTLIVTSVLGSTVFTTPYTASQFSGLQNGGLNGQQGYVQFLATGGELIRSLTFDSAAANAFESANFRAAGPTAVPGPIAGAGLPALFAVAGAWFVRRRKQQAA